MTDGQTDGQTDRQTDENDFTRGCATNVERRKYRTILNFFSSNKKNTKNDKNGKETTKSNDLQIKIH